MKMGTFDDTICQLRDLGMSKAANIIRDLERDNMMLMANNLKHRELIAKLQTTLRQARTLIERSTEYRQGNPAFEQSLAAIDAVLPKGE